MSTEAIATVIQDLRLGRNTARPRSVTPEFHQAALRLAAPEDAPVVNCTGIYQALNDKPEIRIYEDFSCIAPPFDKALYVYVNEHGNVVVMSSQAQRVDEREDRSEPLWGADDTGWSDSDGFHQYDDEHEPDENTAPRPEWERVKWRIDTLLWAGGSEASGVRAPTTGPCHLWQFAVYENGEPADLHWTQIVPEYPMENWQIAHVVLLSSLNFLGCRNVEIVEQPQPRAERRRIERKGPRPTIHTINVFPAGKTTRSPKGAPLGGLPVTPVRGHFASYGEQYGRGKLFGKLEGRFWIPQHARGSADNGENRADYKLVASDG